MENVSRSIWVCHARSPGLLRAFVTASVPLQLFGYLFECGYDPETSLNKYCRLQMSAFHAFHNAEEKAVRAGRGRGQGNRLHVGGPW